MRAARHQSRESVLPASRSVRRRISAATTDRRAVSEDPVLWQSSDGGTPSAARLSGKS